MNDPNNVISENTHRMISLRQEAEMKGLGAAVIFIAALYVVDVTWCNGWYSAVVSQIVTAFYAQWR